MQTREWWTTLFRGLPVEGWLRVEDAAGTRSEADFIERTLGLKPGARVLDVPCGGGRHAFELASRGIDVTGVDLSEEFLANARGRISAGGPLVELHHGDMRQLPWPGRFDAAYTFGNSFAYMDDAGNEEFLRAVAGVLRPGGLFLLETHLLLETILAILEKRTWYSIPGMYCLAQRRHDAVAGTLTSEYTFIKESRIETATAVYRTYSYRELLGMCARAGFEVTSAQGSLEGAPFETGKGLYLTLRKP